MSKGIVILLCIIAVIVGSMAGMAFNMFGVITYPQIWPLPNGIDFSKLQEDPQMFEKVKEYLKSAPALSYIWILIAHWGQAFFGGIVAALIAPKSKMLCAMIVGILTLAGGIANSFMIPAPTWFDVLDFVGYLPLAYLAAKIVGNRGVKA